MSDSDKIDKSIVRKSCLACGTDYYDSRLTCPKDGQYLVTVSDLDLVGSILADRYEILSVVGQGGMGLVYKARHQMMDRVVAVKMLHAQYASNPFTLKRFQQEARTASLLTHPNIIAVHDFGVSTHGLPYLVLDFIVGRSLSELIAADGQLDVSRSVDIFIQACDGLAHAHKKGVIHRDIKPSNIMLVEDGEWPDLVKIVDFGIAKLLPHSGKENQALTQTGEVFGSPLYMSPEQCMGQDLDERSDIYSLACVMYETISGKPPLKGATSVDTMYKHIKEKPKPFSAVAPGLHVPPALEAAVLKALSIAPRDRMQSMLDFKADLSDSITSTHKMVVPKVVPLHSDSEPMLVAESPDSSSAESSLPIPPGARSTHSHPQEQAPGETATTPEALAWLTNRRSMVFLAASLLILLSVVAVMAVSISHTLQTAMNSGSLVKDPNRVWELYNESGIKAFDEGDYAKAESMEFEAIDLARTFGQQDIRLAQSLQILGSIYFHQARYRNAEKELKQALQIRNSVLIPDDPSRLESLDLLANTYVALHKYSDAEPMFKEIVSVKEKYSGPNSEAVSKALNELAAVYDQEGKYQDAEALYSRATSIDESSLGAEHLNVARDLTNLALLKHHQNKFQLAESLYKRSLKISDKSAAPGQTPVLTLNNLGELFLSLGRYDEAVDVLKRALELQKDKTPAQILEAGLTPYLLARAYVAQKKYSQAYPLYKQSLSILDKTVTHKDPRLNQISRQYAELLRAVNQNTEASIIEARYHITGP